MYDICCIGHITLDKIVTPQHTAYMPGGTSFYFSNAIRPMGINYILLTAVAASEQGFVDELLKEGVQVRSYSSAQTVNFENIYGEDIDHRTQRVNALSDPFRPEQLDGIEAKIFHAGPLLAGDIPGDLIIELAARGRVSLDVQGYLREVRNAQVVPAAWPAAREVLRHVHYLKANEHEAEMLTGTGDLEKAALLLAAWGVQEVVITLGSRGSFIYDGSSFHHIPAFVPSAAIDATGCGDTYMAGYLSNRLSGATIAESGRFAAAMATIKLQASGPYSGSKADAEQLAFS